MNVSLRPETERFIEQQVREGHFRSPEELIEAALADLRVAGDSLDAAAVSAINEAEEQADRGEGVALEEFRRQISRRFRDA